MQGPGDGEAAFRDPLRLVEEMVDVFAEGVQLYWRLWRPLGEPLMRGVDARADGQRRYPARVRETFKAGDDPTFLG